MTFSGGFSFFELEGLVLLVGRDDVVVISFSLMNVAFCKSTLMVSPSLIQLWNVVRSLTWCVLEKLHSFLV